LKKYNDDLQNTGRCSVKGDTVAMVHSNGYTYAELFVDKKAFGAILNGYSCRIYSVKV
jgi:hypothetical protein